jgi:hypothetical protein
MRKEIMKSKKLRSRGFTLIASLLLLLLLSGVAIGLFMMVDTESRVGSNDVENTLAYRSAEGAIEQMTSNLAATYQNLQAPQPSDITALNALAPTIPGITFPPGGYTFTPRLNPDGSLVHNYGQVHSGPNAGLYAMITPIDLAVTADRPWGDEVRMLRTVEAAQIPVFQFGVFSDSDLGFFNSPQLDFNGRVHTNGDLYLGVSTGTTLTFHDKITAYGNVIRMVIPNGTAVSGNDGGVWIPTISGGCPAPPGTPNLPGCRSMSTSAAVYREGSVTGSPTSGQNTPAWKTISTGASPSGYNGYILTGNYGNPGGTGAKQLNLPFVSGNAKPFEIIRRLPIQGQPATGADSSRLAYQAQIRVLLSDSSPVNRCADNHFSDWNGTNAEDVILDGRAQNVGGVGTSYFAMANSVAANGKTDSPDWVHPLTTAGVRTATTTWPLVQGCLTVEVQYADGTWHGVTNEWLSLGFARGLLPPASAGPHPNAILAFQMLADRNDNGNVTDANESNAVTGASSAYNWFPINMYDPREGEVRDWLTTAEPAAGTCAVNGVMNAVELDVYNLRRWLKGLIGTTGNQVDYISQNGYVLYFSDRRGMLPDPLAVAPEPLPPLLKGDYGFEDTINTPSGIAGTPDGAAEAAVNIKGTNWSPEDTNQNGRLDKYGATDLALGFGPDTGVTYFSQVAPGGATPPNPYVRVNCLTTARKNWVSGARHVLKLVDGQWSAAQPRLPVRLVANADGSLGGFTVGSENPVYIQGDYNTSVADPMWGNPAATEPAHSAAAVIADSVTLLSNQWQDVGISGNASKIGSFAYPFDANVNRPAVTTYYRVAIAAGKTINFPHPGFANAGTYYGTDGGLHNFLRFLESWNGDNLYYKGSLVSLFYSTYNTGTFKCCQYMVYQPPVRNYVFDPLFTDPKNLPPATPMFRDINNLTYRQDFTPH